MKKIILIIMMVFLFSCEAEKEEWKSTGYIYVEEDVVINEIFARSSQDGDPDWIELYNRGDKDLDIGGYALLDDKDRNPYFIPEGTIIKKGGFLVIWDARVDSVDEGFIYGLGAEDEVRLFNADKELIDYVSWDAEELPVDSSKGRFPDGGDEYRIFETPTPGKPNK